MTEHSIAVLHSSRHWVWGIFAFLSIANPCVQLTAADDPARDRARWENRALVGYPDPPPPYTVERVFTRIEWKAPLYLASEPATNLLWVVLQGGDDKLGRPRIVRFLDDFDTDQTETLFESDGHLIYGLTFHPAYQDNGFVYVFTNGPTAEKERTNRVTRYTVSRQPPFAIDVASSLLILEWRSMGHDGGDLAFGHDGMLYIASGDGTTDSDTWNSGQDVSNLLATLIRIDVDHPATGMPYSVPPDNPFVDLPGARPEIWAYGFRNPWRMSIDAKSGDIWVGNNGQDQWETAYLVRRGDNFGWSVYEGTHPFYPQRRRGPTPIVPPTIEHSHSEFRSLTGGVVYYGEKLPALNGIYVYGDYSTGKIWGARHDVGKLTWHQELADTTLQIAAFRVDQRGELLIVDHGGGIYRLIPRHEEAAPSQFPTRLSDTGLFQSVADHRVHPGLIPYSINAPGWADGAAAERFLAIPGDEQIEYRATRGWHFPNGAAILQTLSLEPGNNLAARRIESRILLRQDKEWTGYSYRWNDEQTDAVLVDKAGAEIDVAVRDDSGGARRRTWRIPSRTECLACHSRAANYVLGPSTLQMDRDHDYGGRTQNQLVELARLGVLTGWSAGAKMASDDASPPRRLVNPYDPDQKADDRARSYLHANCSVCHVEAGGGNARMELEITQAPQKMELLGARPQHDTFSLPNAMLIAPGYPERSVLIERVSRRGRGQMPPLVSRQIDQQAVDLLRDWVRQMKPDSTFVRDWTVDDFASELPALESGRSFEAGKAAYLSVGCAQCHRFAGDGGTVGPDLTGIASRTKRYELIESVLEPSKVVADEYASFIFATQQGTLIIGRVEREDDTHLLVRTGPAPHEVVRLAKSDVIDRRKSLVSNMPAGIVNVLEKHQILDLLAYLISNGNADAPPFKSGMR
jgi:uncharacterized repeat protein (TIGR03806 family)